MDKRSFVFILILSISLFLFNIWFLPPIVAPNAQIQEFAPNSQERLYVLENGTQQIVFSNLGGAIKEINLPFQSSSDSQSIVRAIEFDRKIEKESPQNNLFPLSYATYFDPSSNSLEPYASKQGGYTPLLRRSIKGEKESFTYVIQPKFYMCQLVSELGEMDSKNFQMTKLTKNSIQFSGQVYGQKVTKTYELVEPYGFKLSISFQNAQNRTLYLTNGVTEVELISGAYAPVLQALNQRGEKFISEKIDLPKDLGTYPSNSPVWVSSSNGFFGTILHPDPNTVQNGFHVSKVEGTLAPTRLSLIDQKYELYPVKSYPGYQIAKQIVPQNGSFDFAFYAGPYEEQILVEASKAYPQNPQFELAPIVQGWFSFISEPFARLMFFVMKICYMFTNSWGLSIIGVTIVLRLITFPLNRWSTKSMMAQSELQPEIKAIEERHKKDPKKAQMEIMRLYQERKINPLSGCIPMLIQIPFLIGVFDLFKTNFELRGVPFLFSSWIPNLSAPDILFSWGYPLPYIGNEFHLLPILAGICTFFQTRMVNTTPKKDLSEKQRQAAASTSFMSVLTVVFFYNFAAGVNIYFAFSSLLVVIQQLLMMKISQKPKIQILKK